MEKVDCKKYNKITEEKKQSWQQERRTKNTMKFFFWLLIKTSEKERKKHRKGKPKKSKGEEILIQVLTTEYFLEAFAVIYTNFKFGILVHL